MLEYIRRHLGVFACQPIEFNNETEEFELIESQVLAKVITRFGTDIKREFPLAPLEKLLKVQRLITSPLAVHRTASISEHDFFGDNID